MDTKISCSEALQPLRDYVSTTMHQAPLQERRAMLDTKWPHDRFTAALDSNMLFKLRLCATVHAVEKLDVLSVNEYWGLQLLNLALACCPELPLQKADIDGAATLLLDAVLDGEHELLLRTVNDGRFEELSQTDLQTAKERGFIITDETDPFVECQLTINPIFCIT